MLRLGLEVSRWDPDTIATPTMATIEAIVMAEDDVESCGKPASTRKN
jgi:hypothetical protein